MKRILVFVCIVSLICGISAQASNHTKQTKLIKQSYLVLIKFPSDQVAKKEYLKNFPSNFDTFREIFTSDYLSKDAHDYVYALEDVGKVFPKETLCRIMEMETNAKWDADAINYLQHVTLSLANKFPKEFVICLESFKNNKQKGIVLFLVDGPHRPTQSFLKLVKRLDAMGHSNIAKAMRSAGELAKREGGH